MLVKVLFMFCQRLLNEKEIFANQLVLQKKGEKDSFAQMGQEAEEKHQDGQTAMKSLMPPASMEIGPANCPNPEQVLIPPKQGGRGGDC